jgi:hypothetical protein
LFILITKIPKQQLQVLTLALFSAIKSPCPKRGFEILPMQNCMHNNIFQKFRIAQAFALVVAFLLLIASISTSIYHSSMAFAEAKERTVFDNPETTLLTEYKQDIKLSDLVNALPKTGDYGMVSMTTYINVSGVKLPFTHSQQTTDFDKLQNNHNQAFQTYIGQLIDLKKSGDYSKFGISDFSSNDVKQVIAKYTIADLEAVDLNGSSNNTQVYVGYTTMVGNLLDVSTAIDGLTLTDTRINRSDIENQIKAVQEEIAQKEAQGLDKETALKEVMAQKMATMNPELVNLAPLDQSDISKVNPLTVKDNGGNISVSDEALAATGFDLAKIETVKKLIANYNKLPELKKLDISGNFAFLSRSEDGNIKTTQTASNIFGGIKAQAQWCKRELNFDRQWWGHRALLNKCILNDFQYAYTSAGGISAILAISACPIVCGIITAAIGMHFAYIDWINKGCGENGVYLDINWIGDVSFKPIC